MLRVGHVIRGCGVGAALVTAMFLCAPVWAQTPKPSTPSAATKSAVSSAQAKNKWANKKVVSPYARAAARHERAGEVPLGHAPTAVQGMGKPRKPHPGTPSK
jgi:hypothetical protein